MKLDEAKNRFIAAWGSIGTNWGINRTMAQIHALLLMSTEPLSAEDIMEHLQISRGNANMNIRSLLDWGLAYKLYKPGERREFFEGEKDTMTLLRKIAKIRREKELSPLLDVMRELESLDLDEKNEESENFYERVHKIKKYASDVDKFIETLIKSEKSAWGAVLTMIKKR